MTQESVASKRIVQAMTIALLLYPWINPFAGGPSSSVQPWLASALCVSLLLGLRAWRLPAFPVSLWAAFAVLLAALRGGLTLETVAMLGGVGVVIAMAGVASSAERAEFAAGCASAWLAAACVSAVFALLQYVGASESFVPWISSASLGEAYGNLRQRNQLASLMAIGVASLTWFVGRGLSLRVAMVLVVLLAAGSAASASRTGALQLILLLAFIAAWRAQRRRERVAVAGTGLVAYAVFSALLPLGLTRFWGVSGASVFDRFAAGNGCFSRHVLWSNVADLIAQKPWSGWGWGELDWAHYMTLYAGPRFCDILDNAHNLPLHLAVELGVPVAFISCAGLAWALVRTAPWCETDSTRQLALCVVAVILLHTLLEYPLWYGPFQMAFGIALGFLWPARDDGALTAPRTNACAGIAAVAMMAVAYAAWDYHRISQIYLSPEGRDARYRDDPFPELRKSWLFRTQVEFAELTITPLTRANAQWTYDLATAMLHYSPEPRVIEKIVESGTLLGKNEVGIEQLARFRAAFPREYADWVKSRTR